MSAKKPKITIKNLSKYFDDLVVLDDISFDIYDGEFLCVVGPTGCGKTTFCNVVTRLLPSTKGSVTVGAEAIDFKKHNVSFIFQEPSCLPWRTVWDNVKIGLEIKGYPEPEIRERVQNVLEMTGLTPFKDFFPNQISAGMKQRVAIARAFVTEPDMLLMDEPFGQLDTSTRFSIENSLVRLWEKTKQTVIFVTHNLEEAVYLSERILVLTQKPTKIKSEVGVQHLLHPRDIADPEFVRIRRQVTDLVRWW
ncbi:MAG: ABC transporter ATP-binding protein [Syntrophobacteraceae bacterium]|jgi:ABC-type nitrate/sulfonate/bicarbonate transport system ATPase subunit|nr:ABC transporter ATP-binding protein [Syntrophobacteraceae bacterium]